MRGSSVFVRPVLALAIGLVLAAPASAQFGRVSGTVRDENGKSLKGAIVVAENPDASPPSFTAITNDRGQFAMIGLRSGSWRFTASARGFVASSGTGRIRTIAGNPPIDFRLAKGTPPGAGGVLAGASAKDVQAVLDSAAVLMREGKYDEAIAAYRDALGKAPALTTINLQIARAHRMTRDYDSAVALYQQLLTDGANETAAIELGMTYLEKGDLVRADATLSEAAQATPAGKEVFFSLGEVKFAQNQADEAARYYQKAVDADPSWVKPLLKLGLVAANKGDREGATKYLERALALGPSSGEASQAKAILEQLRK